MVIEISQKTYTSESVLLMIVNMSSLLTISALIKRSHLFQSLAQTLQKRTNYDLQERESTEWLQECPKNHFAAKKNSIATFVFEIGVENYTTVFSNKIYRFIVFYYKVTSR